MADFGDLIQFEANVKTQVKLDYINYLLHLHVIHPLLALTDTFAVDSGFYNDNVTNCIRLLINNQKHLKYTVAALPVFVEYGVMQPTLGAYEQSKKSCQTPLNEIDEKFALTCFLEAVFETPTLVNNPIKSCQQFVLPLSIREHFTLSVINIVNMNNKKYAIIQYYDSYGMDLDLHYKNQLVRFFKDKGYEYSYQCLSQFEQKDNHNCGVFVILKAMDLLNENSGKAARYLHNMDINAHDYQRLFNEHRYQLGMLLKESGANITISSCLQTQIEDAQKFCF